MVDEPEFTTQQFAARIEKKLNYEQVIDYLANLEGQEQVVRVAAGPAVLGELSEAAVVKALGVVGKVEREKPTTTDPRGDGPRAAIWVGESCRVYIEANRMSAAALLTVGPEISMLLVDLGETHLLIQDVLTDPEIPEGED